MSETTEAACRHGKALRPHNGGWIHADHRVGDPVQPWDRCWPTTTGDAWCCFHCGYIFTDADEARQHFGDEPQDAPACQLKAREGGLLGVLRRTEEELETWRRRALLAEESDRVGPLLSAMRRDPNDDVATPAWLFRQMDSRFHFTIDACASEDNHKCKRYWTSADNGLAQDWEGETLWCNPPYSEIGPWVERAGIEARKRRATTVLLVPVWSDRRWFQTWALRATEIIFLSGRVNFPGYQKKNGNPYSYCLLIFRSGQLRRRTIR